MRGIDSTVRKLCSIAADRVIASYAAQRTGRMDIKVVSRCLEQLIRALAANGCDNELQSLINALQSNPEVFRRDIEQSDCLLAVVLWCAKSGISVSPALLGWLDEVRRQLRDATEKPPEKPATWLREAALKCNCRYCAALNTFLMNSMEETTSLAAAEYERSHIVRRRSTVLRENLKKSSTWCHRPEIRVYGVHRTDVRHNQVTVSNVK